MKIQSPPTKKARIEIIPMIDAIFFLLVFFMYSSLSMVKMKAVNVALPTNRAPKGKTTGAKGPGKGQAATPSKLVVTLTANGEYYVNKQKVPSESLSKALAQNLAASPGAVVIINPSKSQTTQALIDTIDNIRRVPTHSGQPLQVLIATEPVDANGMALRTTTAPAASATSTKVSP